MSAVARGVPVSEALASATIALTAAGCETPRLDAELLLCEALGVSRERLLIDRDLAVAGDAARTFQDFIRRRSAEREPVAYILGRRHFRNLELAVDRRALIPRPETELLVEVGLDLPSGWSVLDVGTGSGAVALALAQERPDIHVAASDADEQALSLARENAARLRRGVRFMCADLLTGIPDDFDAVLSNPPYVAELERSTLAPEILRHEPTRALFAGADGLDAIRRLVEQGGQRRRLRLLAIEIGAGQGPPVSRLMRAAGFAEVELERDLAGIERVAVGRR